MNTRKNHEDDEHYHGEPSRTLEGAPFPSSVILYPGSPVSDFSQESDTVREEDIDYWLKWGEGQKHVKQIITPDVTKRSCDKIEHLPELSSGSEQTEPFLIESLHSEPSLLFIPGRLRIPSESWDDLAENDVTVNWISLDPGRDDSELPRGIVLSDWVVQLGPDVPVARSSGVFPGIFHLTNEILDDFAIVLTRENYLWSAINTLLDDVDVKFRPGFLRGRDWILQ